jgi:hypothetical protein
VTGPTEAQTPVQQFIDSAYNGQPNAAQKERALLQVYKQAYAADGNAKNSWVSLLTACRLIGCTPQVTAAVQQQALRGQESNIWSHWRGMAHAAIDVAGVVGVGACIAATGTACAVIIPFVAAGVSTANYAVSGDRHTLAGYGLASEEGFFLGAAAYFPAAAFAEGYIGVGVATGLGASLVGGVAGTIDYERSEGLHNALGFLSGLVVGAIENFPYPFDKVFEG